MAIGTARMATLCLEGASLFVGVDFSEDKQAQQAMYGGERPTYLLYPGEEAIDVDSAPPEGPITLVVIDGTWAHARSLLKHNPALKALPRLSFMPPAPSEYRIRREPRDDYVSTIEAVAHVLGALEGDREAYASMMQPFRAMVDMQLEHRDRLRASRHKKPRVSDATRRARRLPQALRESPDRLLFIAAEANAWPYNPPSPYPDELVHWLAFRPSTGERFEVLVAPRQPLSVGTPAHTRLSEEALRGGGTIEDFARAWQGFVRPDDVVCGWGKYGLVLLAAEGIALPETFVDLRSASGSYVGGRLGTVEACVAEFALQPGEPLGQGRGGVRLSLVSAAGQFLASEAQNA